MSPDAQARRVVLVGGGHAHVQVLRDFQRSPLPDAEVILLVDKPRAVYSGMVPGFVAGQYRRQELEIDVEYLASAAGARLILERATGLDPASSRIRLADGSTLSYDVAAFDIGSTVAGLDLPGVREFAIPTRPIDGFIDRVREIVEKARRKSGDGFRIAVIGGGSGGVELAFTLQQRMTRESSIPVTTLLLEGGEQILKGYPESLRHRVERSAGPAGVGIRCSERVNAVEKEGLVMDTGRRHTCDAVVWVTGASSQGVFAESGLKTDRRGFVLIRSTLQVEGHEELFACGDCATLSEYPDTPKAGVYAVRQGPLLADNLRAFLREEPLRRYRPQKDFLTLLNLGDGTALGCKWGFAFQGRWVMWLKDTIDRRFMDRFTGPAGSSLSAPDSPKKHRDST